MLRNRLMHKDEENRIVVLSSQFCVRLAQRNQNKYRSLVRWVTKQRTPLTYAYVIPVPSKGSHWSLVIVDISTGKIRSVDSMHNDHSEIVERIKLFFQFHWNAIGFGDKPPKWNVKLLVPPAAPAQHDTVNCGVSACAVLDLYCIGISLRSMREYINHRNIGDIRRRMILFMDGFHYK